MDQSPLLRESIQYVTLAASDSNSPRNDTANIVELPDHTLIVVWHKFRPSEHHGSDFGKSDIAMKKSRDGGLTWSGERNIVPVDPGDINVQAPALCLLPNGELLLGALKAHAKDSSSLCLFRSGDSGETWKPAGTIWSRSRGQWLQGGTSSIVRIANGRLIFPFHGGEGEQWSQHNVAGFWISDDEGHNWRKSAAIVDLPMRGAMEASVDEIAPGHLLMSLRTQLGTAFLSESKDGAETWSLPWSSGLTAPESCTCLRRVPGTGGVALFWNGCRYYEPAHHHFGQRNPLSIAYSADAGITWGKAGNVEDDPECAFTNLNCTFTSSGDALFTYWAASPPFGRGDAMKRSDLQLAIIPKAVWDRAAAE